MKVLIIGANSDISRNLIENNKSIDFIELTSSEALPHQNQIDVMNELTYPEINQPLDGFIYFPGSINLKPFSGLKEEDYIKDFNINVLGLVKSLKYYQKNLTENASVIFISSVAAQIGMPYHASISICKSAIEGLTRSLAAEWAPKIRVNSIAPSLVKTKMSSRLLRTEKQIEQINNRHPLKRHGNVNDISSAIEFLLSEGSSWMTGQVLKIDGGMSSLKI
tara:strand:- start:7741 stop:8403 length:663 start_codon:yes stop_codon:yes gene_type:complete